jgi:tetratricopeptide (TPR) repeat protein
MKRFVLALGIALAFGGGFGLASLWLGFYGDKYPLTIAMQLVETDAIRLLETKHVSDAILMLDTSQSTIDKEKDIRWENLYNTALALHCARSTAYGIFRTIERNWAFGISRTREQENWEVRHQDVVWKWQEWDQQHVADRQGLDHTTCTARISGGLNTRGVNGVSFLWDGAPYSKSSEKQALGDRELTREEALYYESLALNETRGQKEGMANAYTNLGILYADRGDLVQAEFMYRKALALNEELDNKDGIARIYRNLSQVYAIRGGLVPDEARCRKISLNKALAHHAYREANDGTNLQEHGKLSFVAISREFRESKTFLQTPGYEFLKRGSPGGETTSSETPQEQGESLPQTLHPTGSWSGIGVPPRPPVNKLGFRQVGPPS